MRTAGPLYHMLQYFHSTGTVWKIRVNIFELWRVSEHKDEVYLFHAPNVQLLVPCVVVIVKYEKQAGLTFSSGLNY